MNRSCTEGAARCTRLMENGGAHLDGITFGWRVLSSFLGWKPESGLSVPVNRPWLLYSSASRQKFKMSLTGLNYPFQ